MDVRGGRVTSTRRGFLATSVASILACGGLGPIDPDVSHRLATALAATWPAPPVVTENSLPIGSHLLSLDARYGITGVNGAGVAAQLDVVCRVDGLELPALHSGSLGLDTTQEGAISTAIDEWVAEFGLPIAAALDDVAAPHLPAFRVGDYRVYAGAPGIRGTAPAAWASGPPVAFQEGLVRNLEPRFTELFHEGSLHAVTLTVAVKPGSFDGECRADGEVAPLILDSVRTAAWPEGEVSYMYKQYFVLVYSPGGG